MTDISKTTPRLWRGLGLTAAVGLAAGPALALGPAPAPLAEAPGPILVQGEGGEAATETQADPGATTAEAGEAGEGGESGEGGEGAAVAGADGSVALLTGLGLMEGHLRTGLALYRDGDTGGAAPHTKHPGDEIYTDLEPVLATQGVESFADELSTLAEAVEGGAPLEQAQAAFDALLARFNATRESVGADAADRFAAMAAILRAAADEHGIGIVEGAVANLQEYQDARGFVEAVRAEAERLAQSGDAAVAEAANEVLTALTDTDAAFTGLVPEGALPTDGVQRLAGAAARAELAGLALQRQ